MLLEVWCPVDVCTHPCMSGRGHERVKMMREQASDKRKRKRERERTRESEEKER